MIPKEKVGIYKIISPSNRIYIGQSRDLVRRKRNYKNTLGKGQPKLHYSILKYGWDAHFFEIVHQLPEDITQEILNIYEVLYWQQYKDCGKKVLNVREPGSNGKLSEDIKRKMSESSKGKLHSEETKRKMSNMRKGKSLGTRTEEQKINISKGLKGVKKGPMSKEHRENIGKAIKGRIPWNKGLKLKSK